ncbi:MAG: PD-(D/E)XK motif protein [Candidatus Cryptobacteroides sp.]
MAEDGHFAVVPIDDLPHKLGVSMEGFPMFFVRINTSASTVQNIIREILSVEYNVSCKLIEENGDSQDDTFCIITLRSLDSPLQSYFIEIFTMMLHKLQPVPSNRELSIEVENLIAIFDSLTNPPKKKIQGLWAELLVIEQSTNPEILINAWHSIPSAKYDFTHGRDKIEVKSTSAEDRVHKFSLDQLNPSPNSRLLIASTIVRESGPAADGLSVKGLYDRILERVADLNSRIRLYTVIAETVGSDIAKLENVYYDYTSAVDSLEFYDYHNIPSILKSYVPSLVTEVRFTSNLSELIDVRKDESFSDEIESSPLFRSLK